MSAKIKSYKCKKCGTREDREEQICIPYEPLVCCGLDMIRDFAVIGMNISQTKGFCGKSR